MQPSRGWQGGGVSPTAPGLPPATFAYQIPESRPGSEPAQALRSDGQLKNKRRVSAYRFILAVAMLLLVLFAVAIIVLAIYLDRAESAKSSAASVAKRLLPNRISDSLLGNYSRLAVAADNGECSAIGQDMLMRGGNVVDAAVATDLCIGLFSAHSAGIGGGFFMTIYNRTTQKCTIIDAREEAPAAATETMFVARPKELSSDGWLAIGVPGELYGLYMAHKSFGKLPWKKLFAPSISLARFGYTVSQALALAIVDRFSLIMADPMLKSVFYNFEEKRPHQVGERIKNVKLADTLEQLANADDPIELFYRGSIAQSIAEEFKTHGGLITLDDLANYKAKVREAITMPVGQDLVACGPPPPASAAVTMAILNVIKGFNFTQSSVGTASDSAETLHKILETMKFAYGLRSELGDADFVAGANQVVANITSPDYGRLTRARITAKTHPTEYYGGNFEPPRDHGTSHISVLDAEGNALSMTTTINLFFGAKRASESTGIIWNDQMDDFSSPGQVNSFGILPSPANFIRPGKRPMSSMSPLVIYRTTGDVRLITGASGGATIISGTAYTAIRNLWFNETVKESTDAPRLHHQLRPDQCEYESQIFPQAVTDLLRQKGHVMVSVEKTGSRVMSIERRSDGKIYANSDYRKEGGFPGGD